MSCRPTMSADRRLNMVLTQVANTFAKSFQSQHKFYSFVMFHIHFGSPSLQRKVPNSFSPSPTSSFPPPPSSYSYSSSLFPCSSRTVCYKPFPKFRNRLNTRTELFCVITQRLVVISYRRFGTTYRSHLQWSRYSLRNKPEERSSHLLRGRSLKPHSFKLVFPSILGLFTSFIIWNYSRTPIIRINWNA